MTRDQLIATRQARVTQLPVTGEILRGSLVERTVRHNRGCTICAGGGGHPLSVLTVTYAGGRTRQFSLRREQIEEVRRWLGNYHKLREALEEICELNHGLLRRETLRRVARGPSVIKTHRAQRSFGDGLIAEEVKDLHEAWMKHADQLLGDPQIVAAVYEALAQRHPQSRKRGRAGVPAEVVLRLLVLKHMRNWSYEVVEREVRANLVYRDFARVGGTKAPDAKTMARWGVALGPEVVQQIHERIVHLAREHRVAAGRRMRVDTTVVETNIHYPTDSSLLGDGVRALTRIMKKIAGLTGAAGAALRDRSRSVKLRVLEIARAARAKGQQNGARLAQAYRRLLEATGRVVGQAKRFATEIDNGVFDRRHQYVRVAGPLIVDLVGDDDLVLRLLQFDHFAEFGRLAGFTFANDLGGGLEQADDLAFGMSVTGKDAGFGLADHLLHPRQHVLQLAAKPCQHGLT